MTGETDATASGATGASAAQQKPAEAPASQSQAASSDKDDAAKSASGDTGASDVVCDTSTHGRHRFTNPTILLEDGSNFLAWKVVIEFALRQEKD